MYGENKKWKELVHEMEQDIIKEREKRGAGEKPVISRFDPNMILPGQSAGQVDYSNLFSDNDDDEEEEESSTAQKV